MTTTAQRIFAVQRNPDHNGQVQWRMITLGELTSITKALQLHPDILTTLTEYAWTKQAPPRPPQPPPPPNPWIQTAKDTLSQLRPGKTPPSLLEAVITGIRSDQSPEGQELTSQLTSGLDLAKARWKAKKTF